MPGLKKYVGRFGYQLGRVLAWPLDRAMRLEVGEIPLVDTQEECQMQYAIQCFGGPKDGHDEILTRERRPEMVYVWHSQDDHRMIKAEKDPAAYEALRARLGVFAYRFDKVVAKEGKPGHQEYWYRYCPSRNKRNVDKAASQPKA